MGWIVAAVLALSACGASRRVVPAPDGGADSDADSDADTDTTTPCHLDADGDGFLAEECGGPDCNDADASIHPGASEGTWEKEVVDQSKDGGENVALALDAEGFAHITYTYSDNAGNEWIHDVSHATNRGGKWSIDRLDERGASASRIAIGDDGTMHIAYVATGWNIRYARHDDAGWDVTIIEPIDSPLDGLGLALDAEGNPHVAYATTRWIEDEVGGGRSVFEIAHAARDADGWTIERMEPSTSVVGVSIAIDEDGAVRLVYGTIEYVEGADDMTIREARERGDVWEEERVAGLPSDWIDIGRFGFCCTDIAIDPSGVAHVSYFGGRLGYATDATGEWTSETTADMRGMDYGENSLALGPDGEVHMSYIGQGYTDGRYYAWEVGHVWGRPGSWQVESIDTWEVVDSDSSIAIDAEGGVHVAYIDGNEQVVYAWRLADADEVDRDCDGERLE